MTDQVNQSIDYTKLSSEDLAELAQIETGAAWEYLDRQKEQERRRETEQEIERLEAQGCSPDSEGICNCDFCVHGVEDDDQPRQYWHTEPPGGHNSWE
jgi:hypothetical protein